MHQTAQRRFCRLVFLVGCIVPTLAVVAWATVENLPSTKTARLAAVEQMLGVRITAASLSTPTPSVTRVEGLTLADLETGAEMLAAAEVTLDEWNSSLRLRLTEVKLSATELPQVAAAIQRLLAVDWPAAVRIEMTEVAWTGEAPAGAADLLEGERVVLTLRSDLATGRIAGRQCTVVLGADGPRLEVLRNRQLSPPATRVVVNTAGQAVPLGWMASLGVLVVDGGTGATFAGEASVTHGASGSFGSATGRLNGVSLAEATKLPIEAVARVDHLNMQWQDERVLTAQGVLRAEAGSMPGALARTFQYLYQIAQPGAQVGEDQAVEFGQLAARFVLNGESLSLGAALAMGEQAPAALLLDREGGRMFGQPAYWAPLADVKSVLGQFGASEAADLAARLPRTTTLR